MSDYEGYVAGAVNAGGTHVEQVATDTQAANSDVSTPYAQYDAFMRKCHLPRTLMKGTLGMREAGLKYLPKEPAESGAAYDARLNSSFLFNAFEKTVKDMTGKVFQREVTLQDDVPAQIEEWSEDIDLAGRHLNVFARDVFFDAMQTGINYILVEMPEAVTRTDGRPVTRADEQKTGFRPYLVHIKADDLIGYKSEVIDGVLTLTQARIRETETVKVGRFAEKIVDQIRVLEPGKWEKWRKVTKDGHETNDWELYQEGTTSLDQIPLVPVYIQRTGFFRGEPPLEDLAWLNCAHWQSQSDQRTILHKARCPVLFGAGFGDDAIVSIGPNSMFRAQDADAKLEWVEITGASIAAGSQDLKDLEFQMQTQGLQLLVPNPGQSATGEVRDDAKENSPLAMAATALSDALENAFTFMAQFMSLGDSGGEVDVNTDFGVGTGTGIDLTTLLTATSGGIISKETFWAEMKRRDILQDNFDADAEKERLAGEDADRLQNLSKMSLVGAPVKSGVAGKAPTGPGRAPAGDVEIGFPPGGQPGFR